MVIVSVPLERSPPRFRLRDIFQVDVDAPYAAGLINYLHKYQVTGDLFLEGGGGICLTRGAMEVLHPLLENMGVVRGQDQATETSKTSHTQRRIASRPEQKTEAGKFREQVAVG